MSTGNNHFSSQLSMLLSELGKSQKELAIEINTSESKISKLICGRIEPKISDIQKIADALKISPAHFFCLNDESTKTEVGCILGNRIYSILHGSIDQNILIIMVRILQDEIFVPKDTFTFLSNFNSNTIFSITPVCGDITLNNKNLKKGIPSLFNPDDKIKLNIGSCYIFQIVGNVNEFMENIKISLPSEELIKY